MKINNLSEEYEISLNYKKIERKFLNIKKGNNGIKLFKTCLSKRKNDSSKILNFKN
jgi:hypothetical protein